MDVVRFGVGHRRPDGPPGTVGIGGQTIHSDRRGLISELAFARNGRIQPHSNPNTTWFVVIEGGGWVVVGEEQARVFAGEAVLWPAHVPHAAWTDVTEMRAIVVEFSGTDDSGIDTVIDGTALPAIGGPVARAIGGLAGHTRTPDATAREGEPY